MKDGTTPTYESAEETVPFGMFEISFVCREGNPVEYRVSPIWVTRIGVDHSVGATSPSISFTTSDGLKCRGSIEDFYWDEASANKIASMMNAEIEKNYSEEHY